MIDTVRAYHPDMSASAVREGMQGQGFIPVIAGVDAPLCQVKIVMQPGKISTPHRHDVLHIFVTLDVDSPPVLTLAGDDLEHAVWLLPGGTLWIPPSVPHVAILPRSLHDQPIMRQAVATENRVATGGGISGIEPQDDVIPMPVLGKRVMTRIKALDLDV
jgi:uncharacterized RmlC-like cupin family protein